MASKMQNTKKTSKSPRSLLEILLSNKKIPLIPPLFCSNLFLTDFEHKTELFKGGLSGRMTWQFLNASELFSP